MKKIFKIGLGIFGITAVGLASLASVISCSSKSNNTSNSSSSSSSNNLSYIPYSDLSNTVIKNGDSNSAWTYATALASWQKIFASYNYKDAVESALNSFFNDYSNYTNKELVLDMKEYNNQIKKDNLSMSGTVELTNYSYTYNSNNTINLSYTLTQNNYYTDLTNNKDMLFAQYITNVNIIGAKFNGSLQTFSIVI